MGEGTRREKWSEELKEMEEKLLYKVERVRSKPESKCKIGHISPILPKKQ